MCARGGIIFPITSGQENREVERNDPSEVVTRTKGQTLEVMSTAHEVKALVERKD